MSVTNDVTLFEGYFKKGGALNGLGRSIDKVSEYHGGFLDDMRHGFGYFKDSI